MNNFWSLVRFEYKKIFVRKSAIVACILAFLIIAFTGFSLLLGTNHSSGKSNYEEMLTDREYKLALSGRELDSELILEASRAYATIPEDAYPYYTSEEYQMYARPYETVWEGMIDKSYTTRNQTLGYKDFAKFTEDQADDYYNQRSAQYRVNLENNPMFSDRNIEIVMEMDSEVQKPIVLEYADGYLRFFDLSSIVALVIMVLFAFVSAPIFSDEYQKRTDSLILTSKNGKSVSTKAKIFAGISLGAIIAIVALLICYLTCMFVYGFDGASAAIQNYSAPITYNRTLFDGLVMLFITTIFGSFLMMSIGLVLSSMMKKTFVALAISMIISVIPMFLKPTSVWLSILKMFSPMSMATFSEVNVQLSWSVFGIDIWLHQAVCIVALVVGTVLLLLTYRNFKKHQVG